MLASRKELRDVRVDTGDENSELSGAASNRERAASLGFSAQDRWPATSASPCAARRCASSARGDTEVPVWVRFAGAEEFGSQDLSDIRRCAAPTARDVPLLSLVDVERAAAAQRRSPRRIARQPTITAGEPGQGRHVAEARKAIEEALKGIDVPARLRLQLRRRVSAGRRGAAADVVQHAARAGDDVHGDGGGVRVAAVPGWRS